MWAELIAFFCGLAVLVALLHAWSFRRFSIRGCHVLITGASKGIGLELAKESVRRQARRVTLVARNEPTLKQAAQECNNVAKEAADGGGRGSAAVEVVCKVLDVTDEEAVMAYGASLAETDPADVLINNAGGTVTKPFDDLTAADFSHCWRLNVMGGVHMCRAILPSMKQRRKGQVVFVSSQAGQVGLYGYSAYSTSKFALRGLSEALEMEAGASGVHVAIAFPPDTDTPGFREESQTRPKITEILAAASGVFPPAVVASTIMNGVEAGLHRIPVGFDGHLLNWLTVGAGPVSSLWVTVQEFLTASVLRLVIAVYHMHWSRVVATHAHGPPTGPHTHTD
ncbi:unnamed protein product [Vitrella brassicaformis CCMP3155]|uniref:3-dehydrosphinganine reductase n=1 Tax=Vitrella brassicaformis (strain CCMP3155) TaxID=1169540 RepID=A0A0G4FPK5_VITBC|nr:unnamed protein product [Vitrella brassicaformis CCMP3155]|eukprot:CEM16393.1 unnamed protein product [Vitrella brassicaformis CCMP3155]